MKILMVSSYLPYPLSSGGHIRLYNLMKNLSPKHQITLACEKRDYQTEADIKQVKKICAKVITFPRKKQWSFNNILKTGFSLSPFLITGHTNKNLKSQISNLIKKEKFDLIHVETSYIMQNIPKTKIPVVLAEHNIEYLVYKRYASRAPLALRLFLNIDILKLRNQEEKFWQKADFLVAVSEDEARIMRAKNKNVTVVPNGVDIENFRFKISNLKLVKNEKRVLFMGDFRWMQNRDTANWIVNKIWPLLKLKISNLKFKINLWIVGRNMPEDIKSLKNDDIIFEEDAHDASEIFQQADLLLAPIRVGGGTSYKILESMASGVPVITTRLGADPLGAVNNKDIVVSENEDGMTNKIIKLLEDKEFYNRISSNARKLIEENYDWEKISQRLEKVYLSAVH